MTTWAIIPVKPLRYGKSRLSRILSPDERARLTTRMLSRTLDTLNKVPAVFRSLVISRDPAALKIARQYDAYTYGEGERQGLNDALARAAHIAAAQEATGVLVVPADLPLITVEDIEMMLAGVAPTMSGRGVNGYRHPRIITICPDRYEDGTNALYVSPPTGFKFHYGEGSFQKHLDEAKALGMTSRIVHTPGLKFDLDTEDDWHTFQALNGVPSQISAAG
ncbi:MAG: 2-phospho-L-lactate guanylyltransferase [Candidatus Promineifilaceae bacterium]|nr:2-phospho-L-lactate guanylyltransferase [Candidatus Promineifilaceae bacterium]